jgi:hypothetical protein
MNYDMRRPFSLLHSDSSTLSKHTQTKIVFSLADAFQKNWQFTKFGTKGIEVDCGLLGCDVL